MTELERKVARLVRNLQIVYERTETHAGPDTGSPGVVADELRWIGEDLARLSTEAFRLSEWMELIANRNGGDWAADAAKIHPVPKHTVDALTQKINAARADRSSVAAPDPVDSGSEER